MNKIFLCFTLVLALVATEGFSNWGIYKSTTVSAGNNTVKVIYDGGERHNMKFGVGNTSSYYLTFKLASGNGTIEAVDWSSSNTAIFKIVNKTGTKANSKCKIKGIKEGHAELVLKVYTSKGTYTERLGISIYTNITAFKATSIKDHNIFAGATTKDYETPANIGYQPAGKEYTVKYACGSYYFVESLDGQRYSNGNNYGFVLKSSVELSEPVTKINKYYNTYFLKVNESIKLGYDLEPYNSSKIVYFNSSNTNIATVSSDGTVQGKSVGTTQVKIYSKYGNAYEYYTINVLNTAKSDTMSSSQISEISNMSIKELKMSGLVNQIFGNNYFPEKKNGNYEKEYYVDENIRLCDTRNCLFESEKAFKTNCYGYAINAWSKPGDSCPYPGFKSGYEGTLGYEDINNIAKAVADDIEALGGTAKILTGSDNNPNYKTTEDQLLIALKTPTWKQWEEQKSRGFSGVNTGLDTYHFMVRKNNNWYFKASAAQGAGIYKLANGKNPEEVYWHNICYMGNFVHDYQAGWYQNIYGSNTQYILISKMPVTIKGRSVGQVVDANGLKLKDTYFTEEGTCIQYDLNVTEQTVTGQIISRDANIAGYYIGNKIPTAADYKTSYDDFAPRIQYRILQSGTYSIWLKFKDGSVEKIPDSFVIKNGIFSRAFAYSDDTPLENHPWDNWVSPETNELGVENVMDGNPDTRWSVYQGDKAISCQTDLRWDTDLRTVTIDWEAAYAKKYEVYYWAPGEGWKLCYSTENGKVGKTTIDLNGGKLVKVGGIKVRCLQRGTTWGYSIKDIFVKD